MNPTSKVGNTYKNLYHNKIVVSPSTISTRSGYFRESNWSKIWLDATYDWRCALGDQDYPKLSSITDGVIVSCPDSFEDIDIYLKWSKSNQIKVDTYVLSDLNRIKTNAIKHKVIRNHNSAFSYAGGYLIATIEEWKDYYKGPIFAVRARQAKHIYETWYYTDTLPSDAIELYITISTIPDLTHQEFFDAGIRECW